MRTAGGSPMAAPAKTLLVNESPSCNFYRDLLNAVAVKQQLWQRLGGVLAKQSRLSLSLEAIAMFLVVATVDYVTGYEVTIFPFYSIPILFALWLIGVRFAVIIAVLSTISWWWADSATGHPYSREWLQVWDAITRLMFFLLAIAAGSAVRKQRDANRSRIDLLEHSQELEREIINISEREQQRIGRDLHDGLGQYLVAVGMAADSLRDDMEKESAQGASQIGKIADLLHTAVVRVRDLSRGLSPVDRDEGGLEAALEELTASASRLSGIPCSFICDGPVSVPDNERAVHLYRIAQEGLNNAIKHAGAKIIVVALEACNGSLSLRISDDGTGMEPANPKGRGMGFNIMRYRARELGGTLEIQPNSPRGTVVVCSIGRQGNIS